MVYGFVIPDFRGGGAEQVLINLANFIAENNTVYLFVGVAKGKLEHAVSSNVNVIELSKSNSGFKNLYPLYLSVKEKKVAYLCGTLSMAFVVPLVGLMLRNVYTVARIGNTLSSDIKQMGVLKRFINRLYYHTLLCSDNVICQSQYMKNDLFSLLPYLPRKKVKVIKNPINNNKLLVTFLPKKNRHYRLVAIGRLEKQKDYHTSLKVVKELVTNGYDVELCVFGEGSLLSELESFAIELGVSEFVTFFGFESNPQNYLAHSDALLLTSIYEGYSNVILESLCLGVPVVATDSPGGNSEIIINGVNGYLSPVADYIDLANKVALTFSGGDELRINIKHSNVHSAHSLENITHQYTELYEH